MMEVCCRSLLLTISQPQGQRTYNLSKGKRMGIEFSLQPILLQEELSIAVVVYKCIPSRVLAVGLPGPWNLRERARSFLRREDLVVRKINHRNDTCFSWITC